MTSDCRSRRVVLLCHERDTVDSEGLAGWLASAFDLVGLILIRDTFSRRWRATRYEWRRSGAIGLCDVLACRTYHALVHGPGDRAWIAREVHRLRERYAAPIRDVPRLNTTDPNAEPVRRFLMCLQPDLMVARCKVILKPDVFSIPRIGTFVLHPGICPEYRNSHGCFWALVRRDLDRVGMTLLQVDRGVDTGPVFLQAGYAFDESRESHTVIQYRVVTENLDAIADTLMAVCRGTAVPLSTSGRVSAVWGQPRLSAYLRWKRDASASRVGYVPRPSSDV